ncbi:MAG: SDR family oxidoreductase [Pseudomonadota bacterium]
MSQFIWQQQTIVLTGAAGGLGQALAEALSQRGARLILVGRTRSTLEALAERLNQTSFVADLTESSERKRLLEFIKAHSASVTGLINNAAVTHEDLFINATVDDVERVITTNLMVPIALTHHLLPLLTANNGWILNVGSVFGAIGFPGQSLYCASKFGLRGFSEALQRELLNSDINVMYAAPRAIKTSLNNGFISRLNAALKTKQDDPQQVAQQLTRQIENQSWLQTLGWPERLFVRLNGLWPEQVGRSLKKARDTLYQLLEEYRHERH